MNVPYGFFGEVLTKYGAEAYEAFQGFSRRAARIVHMLFSCRLVCPIRAQSPK